MCVCVCRYAGREAAAAPATGNKHTHKMELQYLLDTALNWIYIDTKGWWSPTTLGSSLSAELQRIQAGFTIFQKFYVSVFLLQYFYRLEL